MRKRKLGTQGLEVSELGPGLHGHVANSTAPRDDAESIATIHRALELGVDFFDTADMYGPFTNEELVGRALRGRRDAGDRRHQVRQRARRRTARFVGHQRPARIRARQRSTPRLQRLGVDHIDLYYQHRVDPNVPIEDTVGAMAELVQRGQGALPGPVGGGGRRRIRRAHAVHPITALQTEYSLWSREPEDERPARRARAGHRLRRLQPARARLPDRAISRSPDGLRARRSAAAVPALPGRELRTRTCTWSSASPSWPRQRRSTPAQLALAWVLAQGEDIVPIPGTKRRALPGGERWRALRRAA